MLRLIASSIGKIGSDSDSDSASFLKCMRSECNAEKRERNEGMKAKSKVSDVQKSMAAISLKWCDFNRLRRT